MYQVDFVAALFGAFLLLWISKTGKGISHDDVTAGVVVFQAWCTNNDGASLLPGFDLVRCASPELVESASGLLELTACASLAIDKSTIKESLQGDIDDSVILDQALGLTDPTTSRASSATGRITFYDASMTAMPAIAFGGFAIADTAVPSHEVAVGYGPPEPPVFVSISDLSKAFIAVDCKDVFSVSCGDNLALYESSYTGQHPSFGVRVQSSEWPEACLESVSVTPNGSSERLRPCHQ
jgi:hypothetical protein